MKTYKVMLHPTKVQKTRMFQFAGASRYAYNYVIFQQKLAYENGLPFIKENNLRKQFTLYKREPKNQWLYTISNDVLKQSIKDCFIAYKRFFQKLSKYPRYKRRKNNTSFYQDTSKIKITKTHIRIEMLSPKKKRKHLYWVKLAEIGRILLGVKYFNPRFTFDGLNWLVSISVETSNRKPIIKEYTEPIGIDLGIKDLAICSNGTSYPNINKTTKIRKLEKRKKRFQHQISRKYLLNKLDNKWIKTKNAIKLEKRILKCQHRMKNIRNSYMDFVIRDIIQRKPSCIILENLNITGMMKNKHLSKSIQEQSFYNFRIKLEYYSSKLGICIKYADRFYPSSKRCSRCGNIKEDLRLKDRIYNCNSCGLIIDRDLNAAKNLAALA